VVRGLEIFRTWFVDHVDQYVLIGGTAATLAMEEAGLEFRATKNSKRGRYPFSFPAIVTADSGRSRS
jgi:hypothetical protein